MKLLQALKDVPANQRQANFYCVICFMRHPEDPTPLISQGSWAGEIALEPVGTQGFGYDPLFYCPQTQCTAAQCEPTLKNQISHRALAMQAFKQQFKYDGS